MDGYWSAQLDTVNIKTCKICSTYSIYASVSIRWFFNTFDAFSSDFATICWQASACMLLHHIYLCMSTLIATVAKLISKASNRGAPVAGCLQLHASQNENMPELFILPSVVPHLLNVVISLAYSSLLPFLLSVCWTDVLWVRATIFWWHHLMHTTDCKMAISTQD